jgi:hypothetical protein
MSTEAGDSPTEPTYRGVAVEKTGVTDALLAADVEEASAGFATPSKEPPANASRADDIELQMKTEQERQVRLLGAGHKKRKSVKRPISDYMKRRGQLVAFYEHHNPAKMASVDALLTAYNFVDIIASLEKQYKTVPDGWSELGEIAPAEKAEMQRRLEGGLPLTDDPPPGGEEGEAGEGAGAGDFDDWYTTQFQHDSPSSFRGGEAGDANADADAADAEAGGGSGLSALPVQLLGNLGTPTKGGAPGQAAPGTPGAPDAPPRSPSTPLLRGLDTHTALVEEVTLRCQRILELEIQVRGDSGGEPRARCCMRRALHALAARTHCRTTTHSPHCRRNHCHALTRCRIQGGGQGKPLPARTLTRPLSQVDKAEQNEAEVARLRTILQVRVAFQTAAFSTARVSARRFQNTCSLNAGMSALT